MKWIDTTVGDYCPFIYGKGLPQNKRIQGEFPVYGSNGIVDSHSESLIQTPGIIIGRKGSCGAVNISTGAFWPIDTTFYVTKDSLHELYFTYYLLKTLGLETMNSDSAVPGLNRDNAHNVRIRIPEKKEDREKLGYKLFVFDNKIANNTAINQTLEKIAQRIFKSWFIDFDPVKANAEGVPFNGLSPEIQALFPSEFEESELGMIPKGWQVKPFSSIAMLQTKSAKPALEPEKEWVHYSIPAYDDAQFPTLDLGEKIKSNKYKIFENTILVSKLNPRFKRIWFPYIDSNDISSICSTEFMQFIPIHEDWYAYTLSYVISNRFQSEMLKTVSGTTGSRQRAQPNEVSVMPALIPHTEILKAFSGVVLPLIRRHQDNLVQINTLKNLQNRLLPKLISGKIQLSDANQELKEAV